MTVYDWDKQISSVGCYVTVFGGNEMEMYMCEKMCSRGRWVCSEIGDHYGMC